jgi:hypothetical protein
MGSIEDVASGFLSRLMVYGTAEHPGLLGPAAGARLRNLKSLLDQLKVAAAPED